jgi:hypothetical protein
MEVFPVSAHESLTENECESFQEVADQIPRGSKHEREVTAQANSPVSRDLAKPERLRELPTNMLILHLNHFESGSETN